MVIISLFNDIDSMEAFRFFLAVFYLMLRNSLDLSLSFHKTAILLKNIRLAML